MRPDGSPIVALAFLAAAVVAVMPFLLADERTGVGLFAVLGAATAAPFLGLALLQRDWGRAAAWSTLAVLVLVAAWTYVTVEMDSSSTAGLLMPLLPVYLFFCLGVASAVQDVHSRRASRRE